MAGGGDDDRDGARAVAILRQDLEVEAWRQWNLMARVLGIAELMRDLGSFLDDDSLACLYEVLPLRWRDVWISSRHLASWGRRHDRAGGECLLRLLPRSPLLDVPTYLGFRHLHEHARWDLAPPHVVHLDDDNRIASDPMEGDSDGGISLVAFRASYRTHLFKLHDMERPESGVFLLVRACLFLPSAGPPEPFAGNLAVLGFGGHLVFYAPTLDAFKITCVVVLQCSPHGLAISPGGTALLAAHENSVLLRLEKHRARCTFTGVRVDRRNFLGQCFTSESSFLTSDDAGNVWEHALDGDDDDDDGDASSLPKQRRRQSRCFGSSARGAGPTGSVVTTTLLFGRRDYGSPWPFAHGETTDDLALVYKTSTPSSADCLLLAGSAPGRGLGSILRLIFSPRSCAATSTYVFFRESLVASMATHPSQDCVFVVVVTRLKRSEFFAPSHAPIVRRDAQPRDTAPRFDALATGVVAVYELCFSRGRRARAVPRFFLDCAPPTSPLFESSASFPPDPAPQRHRRAYSLYDNQCLSQNWKIQVQARCGQTTLVLRLNRRTLAHLPLVTAPDNTVFCQLRDKPFRVFAFSDHHSFGAVFGAELHKEYRCGLAACAKYNRLHPDVVREIQRRPVTVQHCHAVLRGVSR